MDLSAYHLGFDGGHAESVRSAILRYGLAVGCVAIALGLGLGSELYGTRDLELPVFELAIALVAWFAGIGPSITAVVLSCACYTYFFTEPLYTFEVSSGDLPGFALFIAWAIIVASFVNVRRRVEADLRATRDHLQLEVEAGEIDGRGQPRRGCPPCAAGRAASGCDGSQPTSTSAPSCAPRWRPPSMQSPSPRAG